MADAEQRDVPTWASLRVRLARLGPGLALAAALALASVVVETALLRGLAFRFPATVLSLLIGMVMHSVSLRPQFAHGLIFATKRLLRCAIALLGLRISFADIAGLGLTTALIVAGSMTLTLLSGLGLARVFGRNAAYGALAGGATAVCGASAALALSTVLPAGKQNEADTAFVVLVCNMLATIAMLAYPLLATVLQFNDRTTGILLGATIHDVAQVVGAGLSVSDTATNIATIVKLFRVFLLLPVVLAVGWSFAGQAGGAMRARVPVPVFALVFLVLAGINSLGFVPAPARDGLLEASQWGLLIAIAALGLNTSVGAMVNLGWRHIAVMSCVTLVMLGAVTIPLLFLS